MGDTSTHLAASICGGLVVHWLEAARYWLAGPNCEVCAEEGHEGKLARRCLKAIEQLGPQEVNESAGLAGWAAVIVLGIALSFLGSRICEALRGFEFRLYAAPSRERPDAQICGDRPPVGKVDDNNNDDYLDALDLDNYIPRRA